MKALERSASPRGECMLVGEVLHVESPRQTPNAWDFQCGVGLKGVVRKGQHIGVSFAMRGKASVGDARIAVKLQDRSNAALLREEPRVQGEGWRECFYTCIAGRDYEDGELSIGFFLGLARQAVEIAGLSVEVSDEELLPKKPSFLEQHAKELAGMESLSVPDGEKRLELAPLDASVRATKRYILIKLDDVADGNEKSCIKPGIRRVTDYLVSKKIPASLGVVCNSLEKDKPYYIEWLRKNHFRNGGLFDYWQHGWTHAMNIPWKDGKTYFAEYGIPDAAYQRENFEKSQRIFLEKVGYPFEGFCAPCGLVTEETRVLLREHKEIKTWLYGDMNDSCGKFSFRRTCNLESAVGRVEYNAFIRQYRGQRDRDYIMLQGHPAMWNGESFEAFKGIVEQLEADGWIFTTATQYVELIGWKPPEEALFAFPMGGDAPNEGIADVSFLNEKPAGANGLIRVKDGHFVDGNGKRIRFLATNLTFSEAFPTHEKADALAARFASLGFNAVRIHHIDKHSSPAGIWKKGPKLDTLDPEQLDRIHYLVSVLKKQGIYTDFNLHVSREYWRGADFSLDGLADDRERDQVLPKYGKGLDRIFDRYIEMQRDYARDVLLAPNPYTGMPLAKDPAVFLVEINNENTLFELQPATLPEYYQSEIRAKWNDWLIRRYETTEALRKAWGTEQPLGEELLSGVKATAEGPNFLKIVKDEEGMVRAELVAKPDENWQAQLQWRDLTLEDGQLYTFSFEVRSEVPRKAGFTARRQVADWRNLGLSGSVQVGKEWTSHTCTFTARGVEPGLSRIDFPMGGAPLGVIEFRKMSLRPGGASGLLRGESLEDGTVSVDNRGLGGTVRGRDWTEFLCDVERGYGAAMRAYLKEEVGCKALIFDSQASYGSVRGLYREALQDVIDMHSYWQHPSFPRKPWDMSDWAIGNTPMSFAPEHAANFGRLASYRVSGKPFTVSEYDHPAPNAAACEMFPMVAAYGALQDWDGIFQFDWGSSGSGENKIGRFFDLQNHAGKLAFLPASALVFRGGILEPHEAETSLVLPAYDFAYGVELSGDPFYMYRSSGATEDDFLGRRLAVRFDPMAKAARLERKGGGSETSALVWDAKTPFMVDVPSAKIVVGRCTGTKTELDGVTFELAKNDTGFAAVALVAMDRKPLRESDRLLLTVAGNVENTGMGWNARRTSVGTKWGSAPTRCEAIEGDVALQLHARKVRIWALDGKGKRMREVSSTLEKGVLRFRMGAEAETLWYEIEAVN